MKNSQWMMWCAAAMTAGMAMCSTGFADVVDFTAGEGYADGSLDNQPSGSPAWNVVAATSPFTVDATGGTVAVNVNQTSNTQAVYQSPQQVDAGQTLNISIDFSFEQLAAATSGQPIALTVFSNANGTSTSIIGVLTRTGTTDAYGLLFYENSVSPGTYKTANVAGANLGLNSGNNDNASDSLRLSLSLTKTTTTNIWDGLLTLTNLSTNQQVGQITAAGFDTTAVVYGDTSLYAAIDSKAIQNASLSSFSIDKFAVEVVPEPASLSLLAIGGFMIAAMRR